MLGWFAAEPQPRVRRPRKRAIGGIAYETLGTPAPDATIAKAKKADAVLFGAVGGPKWDALPFEKKPERGLLRLRKDLGLFANLRPALCFDALKDASSLKPEIVAGLDILIVRELTGGVYFGEPKEITDPARRPEARRRHAGLYDAARSSASRAWRSSWRGCAASACARPRRST